MVEKFCCLEAAGLNYLPLLVRAVQGLTGSPGHRNPLHWHADTSLSASWQSEYICHVSSSAFVMM
jgi:hypothetical protein